MSARNKKLTTSKRETATLAQSVAEVAGTPQDAMPWNGAPTQRDAQAETHSGEIATHVQENVTRAEEDATLMCSVTEMDGQIAALVRATATQNQELATLERAMATQNQELASLERAMATQNQELASLGRAMATQNQELASLVRSAATQNQELASLEKTFSRLLGYDEKLCVRDCMRHLEQHIALAVVRNKQFCVDFLVTDLEALKEEGYDASPIISDLHARALRGFREPGNDVAPPGYYTKAEFEAAFFDASDSAPVTATKIVLRDLLYKLQADHGTPFGVAPLRDDM